MNWCVLCYTWRGSNTAYCSCEAAAEQPLGWLSMLGGRCVDGPLVVTVHWVAMLVTLSDEIMGRCHIERKTPLKNG